jgi:ABC-type multidrug transport system fused ATPase/permease subunit
MTLSEKLELGIRGLFCGALYFLFMASFLFCTKYILKWWLNIDYTLLGILDWLFIISILIFVGVLMLYLTPILEKYLYNYAQSKIRMLSKKPDELIKEKEAKRVEKAKEKDAKREERKIKNQDKYGTKDYSQPSIKPTGGVPPLR